MVKWTGKRIVKLSLFQQKDRGIIGIEHYFFFLLYMISLYFCFQTIGEQYIEALTKAEEQQINIYDDSEKARMNALSYLQGKAADTTAKGPSFIVPSQWLPGFWPSIALGVSAILHALMILGQKWSISFRCLIGFRKVQKVSLATHVHLEPNAHQGKPDLVPIQRTSTGNTFFEFHRRKYVYNPSTDTFTKISCRTDYELVHYMEWSGIPNPLLYDQLKEVYGANKFQMASPSFMDLYYIQVTSPLTVFQIFCSLLWCLDEYWQYSLFTLFMVFTFEATTVFQRMQSMKMLKGMGNEARPVKVFRFGKWTEVSTEDLVPGDLFSLTKTKDDVIPCDAIILFGGAVVNESSLTGESVPQMKDGITGSKGDDLQAVSIKGEHKVHALFGGTRVLQVTSMTTKAEEAEEDERDRKVADGESDVTEVVGESGTSNAKTITPPPDNGCVCYVARTGFSSSQGKLVRMIENSQASVRSDSWDTALLLLLLLIFALTSSGYVLYKGMQDGTQSRYQLLLHCILIVTSVIPPELPMQTALAVNNSLMTLMKMQIFCTEPFRVPIAGKVDTCVFDKTGTLTTDELVAVGVVHRDVSLESITSAYTEALLVKPKAWTAPPATPKPGPAPGLPAPPPEEPISSASSAGMTPMAETSAECTLVLGGCHSLVMIDGKVGGDPLEVASLKSINWELSPNVSDVARPKPETLVQKPKILNFKGKNGLTSITLSQVKIIARHHFSSKLQRMSVVVRVAGDEGSAWVLVKGSPEALAAMCDDCPADFAAVAGSLAKRGMRVIALGLRRINADEVTQCSDFRAAAETKIHFAGFISFTCRVRKDTASILKSLRDGGHVVAMATGDAMLTAVHVAKEVGITTQNKAGILLLESSENGLFWTDYESGNRVDTAFVVKDMTALALKYDLCVSGKTLSLALESDPTLAAHLNEFVVFARMRPDEKERVLLAMKDHGHVTLMCGDGANDVGALKQAHVGVALLSGFGDLNVARDGQKKEEEKKRLEEKTRVEAAAVSTAIATSNNNLESDQELNAMKVSELKKRLRLLGVEPDDFPDCVEKADVIRLLKKKHEEKTKNKSDIQKQKELMAMTPKDRQEYINRERRELAEKKQKEFQEEYEQLVRRGESWAMVKAIKNIWDRESQKTKELRQQQMSITGSAGRMAAFMDGLENIESDLDLPMVKIGDASVASPFTSKMPSIRGTLDIIRQGRCTLVTTIQMYQILALNCLINAYSLSVLRLDGIKYGDIQMTCLGILMSVSFITISRSKPLEQLSAVRPLHSIFHPALFLSLMGQFTLHLVTMMYLVHECKKLLPADYQLEKSKVFQPNIVNSVVFLVTAVQQVSVFVVNLKGPPFMGGLSENTPLMYSLVTTFVGTFMCASEYIPQMNKFLQLEPFPSIAFRNTVLGVLAVDVLGTFLWDRLMLAIFALPILTASLRSTTRQDVFNMIRGAVITWFLVSFIASMDYTEIAKEMDRYEQEQAAAAAKGVRAVEADSAAWSV